MCHNVLIPLNKTLYCHLLENCCSEGVGVGVGVGHTKAKEEECEYHTFCAVHDMYNCTWSP